MFRLVPQKVPLKFRFGAEKYFLRNLCYFFDSKSPMFVIWYDLTEIKLWGILLQIFYIFIIIIVPKIGHIGLFCNPKLF